MKKLLKNSIFTFILGAIIFSCIGVYATITYQAHQIIYNDTPLDKVLDDLYDKVDGNITFNDAKYGETLTEISSTNRRQNIELTKGTWIITFVRSSSWNRNAETNQSGLNSGYTLICGNDNSVTRLTGKVYQKSGTSPANGNYVTGRLYETMFQANITTNTDTCYVEYKDNGDLASSAEIITIQGIKLNQ